MSSGWEKYQTHTKKRKKKKEPAEGFTTLARKVVTFLLFQSATFDPRSQHFPISDLLFVSGTEGGRHYPMRLFQMISQIVGVAAQKISAPAIGAAAGGSLDLGGGGTIWTPNLEANKNRPGD